MAQFIQYVQEASWEHNGLVIFELLFFFYWEHNDLLLFLGA